MNTIMYMGGLSLAVICFILAVLSFFIFKIPSVHSYFGKNKKRGLVKAVAVNKTKEKPTGPQRITQEEYENLTEVLHQSAHTTQVINGGTSKTLKKLKQKNTSKIDSQNTEELSQTEQLI